jgi:hypothetical protein
LVFLEPDVRICQRTSFRPEPVLVGDGRRIHKQGGLDVIGRPQPEGFFLEPGIDAVGVDGAGRQPALHNLCSFQTQGKQGFVRRNDLPVFDLGQYAAAAHQLAGYLPHTITTHHSEFGLQKKIYPPPVELQNRKWPATHHRLPAAGL